MCVAFISRPCDVINKIIPFFFFLNTSSSHLSPVDEFSQIVRFDQGSQTLTAEILAAVNSHVGNHTG